jgi:hypothetical protein
MQCASLARDRKKDREPESELCCVMGVQGFPRERERERDTSGC